MMMVGIYNKDNFMKDIVVQLSKNALLHFIEEAHFYII